MPNITKLTFFVGAGIAGFALLLLIISVGTPVWLDDGVGDTVGLFRQCYGANTTIGSGCFNQNQVTQGGLAIFGLLLLAFGVITTIASPFLNRAILFWVSLGLLYFASMFVMSAYATWGTYARDPSLYYFPYVAPANVFYTSMGYSYHLCVAAHYFLWTALTIVAFGAGHFHARGAEESTTR
jgi:hypothetical protein